MMFYKDDLRAFAVDESEVPDMAVVTTIAYDGETGRTYILKQTTMGLWKEEKNADKV
jgi:hypothetical protein